MEGQYMALPSNTLELPKPLRDLILDKKKCVAFVGSGLSAGCFDSWPDLVNKLCERCGSSSRVKPSDTGDALLDAAQNAKDADAQAYYKCLGEHFGKPAPSIPRQYLSMLSLPFSCYLTVNLDPLLSVTWCIGRNSPHDRVNAYPSLDRALMKDGSIHYLHGYIPEGSTPEPGSIVLARREFEQAYTDNSNLMTFLIAALEHDPIVFVGCRLQEPVMSRLFELSKRNQEDRKKLNMQYGRHSRAPMRFIFLATPEVRDSRGHIDEEQCRMIAEKEDARYKEMDIITVRYPAPGGDHSALWSAMEQLGNLARLKLAPDHGWGGNNVD
jgi:hypothetical protein